MVKLKKGDKAPDFELLDHDGTEEALVDHRGEKILLFFYPRAGTSGCTLQAESVMEAFEELEDQGIFAMGISPDTVGKQKKFHDDLDLEYPLLSDPDHVVAEAYGVWGEKNIRGKKTEGIIRSSFLIDEHGKILGAWYGVKPDQTAPKALEALEDEGEQGTE
jgi:thioredoxin-dependent peroxiredoxin